MNKQDIRWKQRFQNFQRAFGLLREVIENQAEGRELNELEKEGAIQRFNFTLELAWNMIKDRMELDGILVEMKSPKAVFKQAYQSGYISDIEVWLNMVNDRNLVSHTYNFDTFENVLESVQNQYFSCFETLYLKFLEELTL